MLRQLRRPALVISLTTIAVLISAGVLIGGSSRASSSGIDDIPLATVAKGDVDIKVYSTGEVRASHAMMLNAPSVGGGALQITKLLATSTPVKKGDVVIEFDPSEQRYKLEQSRSELLQAEQEITKANADAAVLAAQDKVAELKARFDVRQAELDVQKNELVSSIEGKKNDLALQQAKRIQTELEQDMKSHKESGKASIYLAREKYNKAKLQMDQAQQNIDKMQVTSPMDGLVSIQKNQTGDFFFTGMSVPDFHTGDQAHPGSAIAQIVDPSGLELSAKLPEQDSTAIKAGQPVDVVFDAMPGHKFRGTVKTIGGVSSANIFEGESGGNFEVTLQLATLDPRLHPGFTAQLVFVGDHKSNALYIPKQAVFLKDGKRVVYIKRGGAYDPQVVKIVAETESRAVIDSLSPGTQVALIDPTAPRKPSNMSPASTGTP